MSDNEETMAAPRVPTAVDTIAEDYVRDVVRISPLTATYLGMSTGADAEIDDLSPDGHEELSRRRRATLGRLDDADPADDVDRVTLAAMRERLGLDEELYDAGLPLAQLNVIDSPLQFVREVFDLMPRVRDDDWATIARRLSAVPAALSQWHASLCLAADRGLVSPVRQVEACLEQVDDMTASDGFFATLGVATGSDPAQAPRSESVRRDLRRGAEVAAAAYRAQADRLRRDILPRAPRPDACGRDRYRLHSRAFLGTRIDLAETYDWGLREVARIGAERRALAERISPGQGLEAAIAALSSDPSYRLIGADALRDWMQRCADHAIAALDGVHVDIPAPVRRVECLIAPVPTGGIYYTAPSDDLSRPGQIWWGVPKGVTEFSTWQHLTTVYHEGVPGHHLQVGRAVYRSATLNSWRRLLSWTSGHGEGWALYAEALMRDLGFMSDPGYLMGQLGAESLRAARVVIDIGVHAGFDAPAEVGGGSWDYDKAWAYLVAHSTENEPTLRFELDRYLGWPGQAASYKVGQRHWQDLRAEVAAAEGPAFELRTFHRRALDLGGLGLDTLRDAMLGAL